MFGFFKRVNYRTKCAEIFYNIGSKRLKIELQQCIEFVEDYKNAFNAAYAKNLEPSDAVMQLTFSILDAMVNDKHKELGEDLFPRDFILNIPRPSNHIGPEQFFGISPDDELRIEENNGYPLCKKVFDGDALLVYALSFLD